MGVLIIGDVVDTYDVVNASTSDFDGINDTFVTILDVTEEIRNKTFDVPVEGTDESWTSLVKGSYNALRKIPTLFTAAGSILKIIQEKVGIPPILFDMTITILVISVVFGIIHLVFRFKG